MSSPHVTRDTGHGQGTARSYVVGFILSLVCTIIPYSLVVNHSLSRSALMVLIFGFALLQMVIQITFFLHLGRGPKPRWNLLFFVATVALILVIVGGSVMIMSNLHYNMMPSDQTKKLVGDEAIYQIGGEKTGACQGQYDNHKVTIENGQATPAHTDASKCDTLTFVNQDSYPREITFGTHPGHAAYAGEDELDVQKGRGETITLSEVGTYQFHDHLHPDTTGDFTVTTR